MASLSRFRWIALIALIAGLARFGAPAQASGADPGLSRRPWQAPSELLPAPSTPQQAPPPAYIKASNTGADDTFGYTVAIDGDTMVVGAPYEDSAATGINGNQQDNSATGSGAAYVYVRTDAQGAPGWSQQAYLKASNTGAGDQFGYSVAISGDTIVVGAWREASAAQGVNGDQNNNAAFGSGAAYVFVRTGTTWSQQAYLKASNTDAGVGDQFGCAVSIDGDTIVVGAYGEESAATGVNGDQQNNSAASSGAAYVYVRSGTTWSQQAYLKASNTESHDIFGFSVAVDGDTVVVGALLEQSGATGVNGDQQDNSVTQSGAVYVFVRTGTTWSQQAYVKSSNPNVADLFGYSSAIDGDTIVIGAWLESSASPGVNGNQLDNSAPNAGAAYVFVRNGTTWSQQAYLKSSNPEIEDQFGAVAIEGDRIVVGAIFESSAATGIDGNQRDNSAPKAGAAYVFVRTGTAWSQQAYVKASNTGSDDEFGRAVAIDGDTIIVGASAEASAATGIDGNQLDNSATDAGAVYVVPFPFLVPAISWNQPAAITYGAALGAGQLNATANVAGTFSYAPPAGTILAAGPDQPLSVSFTPANGAIYASASATVTLDVLPAPLTISADNQMRRVGQPNPPLTASYSGFVNSDTAASLTSPAVLATTATASSQAGRYPITVSGAASPNYAITAVPGTLTVTRISLYLPLLRNPAMPDLVGSIALSPDARTFAAGDPVQISVTITNTGDAPSAAAWADLYINPATPPSAPNSPWYETCGLDPCTGIVWRIPALAPGAHVTLTSTPASYAAGYTIWPGFFVAGTTDIYLFVDSYNAATTTGAVLESNEQNNRAEIHGLSVTGTLPDSAAIPRPVSSIPARPQP
jgi:hypothetical protein